MKNPPFDDLEVKAVFDGYPPRLRKPILALRRLIFETAAETDGVGRLVETLKWRQPAYLTERPKSGSTIRIDTAGDGYAMFFHCQTSLVMQFRDIYPDDFVFQDNRALLFAANRDVPHDALKHCIALALTYHLRSR